MNERIKIDIDINLNEVREFRDVINDLQSVVGDLHSTVSTLQGSFHALGRELSSSSGAFQSFTSGADLMVSTLTLLALANTDLKRIPTHLKQIGDKLVGLPRAFSGFTSSLMAKKGAVGLLGGALKVLPFVAVIGGIGLLIDAFANAGSEANTTRNRIRDLNQTLDENRQAHYDAIAEINENERSSGALVSTLLSLNDRARELNDGREELIRFATILNEAENDLNVIYEEQTGLLTDNSVAVVEQERDRIAMNSSLERSTQHFESLEDAIIAEYQANYDNAEALETLRQRRDNLNDSLYAAYNATVVCHEALEVLYRSLASTEAEYESLQGTLDEFNDDVVYHFNNWMEEQNAFREHQRAFIEEHGITYEILSDQQRDFIHSMVDYFDYYVEMGSTMFRKLATENELSLADIANNMEYNLTATEEWQRNLSIIAAKYGDEVAGRFRAMGEEGISVAAMMAEEVLGYYAFMENGSLVSLNDMERGTVFYGERIARMMGESVELGCDIMISKMGEGSEAFIDIIKDLSNQRVPGTFADGFEAAGLPEIAAMIPKGGAEGVENNESIFTDAVYDLGKSGNEAFAKACGIKSPSRVFMDYGTSIIQGLDRGIDSLKSQPKNTLQSLATAMKAIYNSARADYQTIGQTMMDGLNAGLLGREHMLMGTARRIASQIRQTINNAINQTSGSTPSFAGAPSTSAPAPAMLSNIDTGYAQKFLHNSYHGFSPAFTNQLPVSSLVRNINHTTTHNSHNANNVTLNMGSTNPEYAFTRTNRYLRNLK